MPTSHDDEWEDERHNNSLTSTSGLDRHDRLVSPVRVIPVPSIHPAVVRRSRRKSFVRPTVATSATSLATEATTNLLRDVVRLLMRPLPLVICTWILVMIFGRLVTTIQVALSPLCLIPGISSSTACLYVLQRHEAEWKTPALNAPQWADYPALVPMQTATFGQLLNEAIGGSTLSLEIRKAGMAVTDLVTLVRLSDLESKDVIADLLEEFVDDARWTARGLQRLCSKVLGAVDL
jgi:hypothetical protein